MSGHTNWRTLKRYTNWRTLKRYTHLRPESLVERERVLLALKKAGGRRARSLHP